MVSKVWFLWDLCKQHRRQQPRMSNGCRRPTPLRSPTGPPATRRPLAGNGGGAPTFRSARLPAPPKKSEANVGNIRRSAKKFHFFPNFALLRSAPYGDRRPVSPHLHRLPVSPSTVLSCTASTLISPPPSWRWAPSAPPPRFMSIIRATSLAPFYGTVPRRPPSPSATTVATRCTSCRCAPTADAPPPHGPRTALPPGAEGTVSATYDAALLGRFEKQLAVYTNLSATPLRLTLSGDVAQELNAHPNNFSYHVGDIYLEADNVEFR